MRLITYGQRLSYARELAGITQKQLGKLIDQAPTTIANIEQGNTARSTRTVQIAAALGVRAEWLEHGYEPMVRSPAPEVNDLELLQMITRLPPAQKAAVRALVLSFAEPQTAPRRKVRV
jgi:transcriptional regulator with XRE-family HTH domain